MKFLIKILHLLLLGELQENLTGRETAKREGVTLLPGVPSEHKDYADSTHLYPWGIQEFLQLTHLLQGGLREAVLLQVEALFNCTRMDVH